MNTENKLTGQPTDEYPESPAFDPVEDCFEMPIDVGADEAPPAQSQPGSDDGEADDVMTVDGIRPGRPIVSYSPPAASMITVPSKPFASDETRAEIEAVNAEHVAIMAAEVELKQQRDELNEATEWSAAHDEIAARVRSRQLENESRKIAFCERVAKVLERLNVDRAAAETAGIAQLESAKIKVRELLSGIGYDAFGKDTHNRPIVRDEFIFLHPSVVAAARELNDVRNFDIRDLRAANEAATEKAREKLAKARRQALGAL